MTLCVTLQLVEYDSYQFPAVSIASSQDRKMYPRLHVIFLWKGTVFSRYSPSEHHHIPMALQDEILPFLRWLSCFTACMTLEMSLCVSLSTAPCPPCLYKHSSKTLLLFFCNHFTSKKFPLWSQLFSIHLYFSLIPLMFPLLLLLSSSIHRFF